MRWDDNRYKHFVNEVIFGTEIEATLKRIGTSKIHLKISVPFHPHIHILSRNIGMAH